MKRLILIALLAFGMNASAQTIFGNVGGLYAADAPVELGTRFSVSEVTRVTALRFYKATADTQSVALRLYDETAVAVSASYSGSATGWVSVPINQYAIFPGHVYTVSYFTRAGYQASTSFVWPVKVGPLTASGGFFKYGGGYPDAKYMTSNYYADLVFSAESAVIHDTVYIDNSPTFEFFMSDSGGTAKMNDTTTLYRYVFGVQPPHERLVDSVPRVYRFNYSGYEITLFNSGAWIRRKVINGVKTVVPYPTK